MGYKVMLNHWVIKDDMMSSKKVHIAIRERELSYCFGSPREKNIFY